MTQKWYVAYTKPLQEQRALLNLAQQDFKAFAPHYKKRRRHARSIQMVSYPLFPRYLFIQLDLEKPWQAVCSTRGIAHLLMDNDRCMPIAVPDQVIETLTVQQDPQGNVPIESLALFQVGDKLRVKEGPFVDQVGIYQGLDDQQRVQLLLNFMQKSVKLQVPIYAVEAE